jgi:hypothetical protein
MIKELLIIALIVALMVVGPIFTILALNLIFPSLAIPLNFWTWLAIAWLTFQVGGTKITRKVKKG